MRNHRPDGTMAAASRAFQGRSSDGRPDKSRKHNARRMGQASEATIKSWTGHTGVALLVRAGGCWCCCGSSRTQDGEDGTQGRWAQQSFFFLPPFCTA